MTRLLSLLVALVTAVGGHALVFWSGFYLFQLNAGANRLPPVAVVPLAIVGVLVIGVTALTAAWSSLGVHVVGAIEVVLGLALVVVPVRIGTAISPAGQFEIALLRGAQLGAGAAQWFGVGALLVEGVLLLVFGVVASRRRRGLVAHPGIARVVAFLVTMVALAPSALLALHGGTLNERSQLAFLRGPDAVGLAMLVVGTLLLGALALGARWSGLGAIVWGAVLAFAGLSAAVLPALVPPTVPFGRALDPAAPVYRALPDAIAQTTVTSVSTGVLAAIGITFLGGGIAAAVAGRTGRRRATFVDARAGQLPAADGAPAVTAAPWADPVAPAPEPVPVSDVQAERIRQAPAVPERTALGIRPPRALTRPGAIRPRRRM